jgi:hypothetical protein
MFVYDFFLRVPKGAMRPRELTEVLAVEEAFLEIEVITEAH